MIFDIIVGTPSASATSFTPASLFALGEVGVWYDPSDLSTMFQDSAGTIPVTANGQPVGKILDKSGNNRHATQSTPAARPLYNTSGGLHWLKLDGYNTFMQSANIDFTTTANMSVFHGVRKDVNSDIYAFCQLGPNATPVGGFVVGSGNPTLGSSPAWYATYNPSTVKHLISPTTYPAPQSVVHTALFGPLANDNKLRLDSVVAATGVVAGPASYANTYLQISRSGFNGLPGNIYSTIILGRAVTAQELIDTERWIANKTGVTIP